MQTNSRDLRLAPFSFLIAFIWSDENVTAAGASSHLLSFSIPFSSDSVLGYVLREWAEGKRNNCSFSVGCGCNSKNVGKVFLDKPKE